MLFCVNIVFVLGMARAQYPASPHPSAAENRVWFYASAALALLLSIFWNVRLVPPFDESESALPRPEIFQRQSLVSLVLAETCAVVGFVYCISQGGSVSDYLPFGGAALLVMGAVCLPKGLAYWSAWESRPREDSVTPPAS